MRRLVRLAPLVAACFVAGVAVPRATYWRHHHAGGEHAHVHEGGPERDDHDDDHDDDHHHHEQPHHHHDHHHDHDDGPGLHATDGGADHAHWQHPFLRVDRTRTVVVARIDRIAWLPAIHAGEPAVPARPAQRSRGPPRV